MCAQGMYVDTKYGKQLALKATRWMSNSRHVLDELDKHCTGGHEHASLQNGVAAQAAIWTEKLCYSILRGLRKHLTNDQVMCVDSIGTVREDVS